MLRVTPLVQRTKLTCYLDRDLFLGLFLDAFGDCDHPAFGIFEGEFAHAVELIFERLSDLRAVLLHLLQYVFDAVPLR